eukprot:Awhi_evm1s13529
MSTTEKREAEGTEKTKQQQQSNNNNNSNDQTKTTKTTKLKTTEASAITTALVDEEEHTPSHQKKNLIINPSKKRNKQIIFVGFDNVCYRVNVFGQIFSHGCRGFFLQSNDQNELVNDEGVIVSKVKIKMDHNSVPTSIENGKVLTLEDLLLLFKTKENKEAILLATKKHVAGKQKLKKTEEDVVTIYCDYCNRKIRRSNLQRHLDHGCREYDVIREDLYDQRVLDKKREREEQRKKLLELRHSCTEQQYHSDSDLEIIEEKNKFLFLGQAGMEYSVNRFGEIVNDQGVRLRLNDDRKLVTVDGDQIVYSKPMTFCINKVKNRYLPQNETGETLNFYELVLLFNPQGRKTFFIGLDYNRYCLNKYGELVSEDGDVTLQSNSKRQLVNNYDMVVSDNVRLTIVNVNGRRIPKKKGKTLEFSELIALFYPGLAPPSRVVSKKRPANDNIDTEIDNDNANDNKNDNNKDDKNNSDNKRDSTNRDTNNSDDNNSDNNSNDNNSDNSCNDHVFDDGNHPKGKGKTRINWSLEEIRYLKNGYKKYGGKWTTILNDSNFRFHKCRLPASLSVKWKQICQEPSYLKEIEKADNNINNNDNDSNNNSNNSNKVSSKKKRQIESCDDVLEEKEKKTKNNACNNINSTNNQEEKRKENSAAKVKTGRKLENRNSKNFTPNDKNINCKMEKKRESNSNSNNKNNDNSNNNHNNINSNSSNSKKTTIEDNVSVSSRKIEKKIESRKINNRHNVTKNTNENANSKKDKQPENNNTSGRKMEKSMENHSNNINNTKIKTNTYNNEDKDKDKDKGRKKDKLSGTSDCSGIKIMKTIDLSSE